MNTFRITGIGLIFALSSVFFVSEAGFPFFQGEYSTTNDYCQIVDGADLNLAKTANSTSLKLKIETTICTIHCINSVSSNFQSTLKTDIKPPHNRIQYKVYLLDCSILI